YSPMRHPVCAQTPEWLRSPQCSFCAQAGQLRRSVAIEATQGKGGPCCCLDTGRLKTPAGGGTGPIGTAAIDTRQSSHSTDWRNFLPHGAVAGTVAAESDATH